MTRRSHIGITSFIPHKTWFFTTLRVWNYGRERKKVRERRRERKTHEERGRERKRSATDLERGTIKSHPIPHTGVVFSCLCGTEYGQTAAHSLKP